MPANVLAEVVSALRVNTFDNGQAVLDQISTFTQQHREACVPAQSQLAALSAEIDRIFAGNTMVDILAAISDAPGDWAAQTAAMLRSRSPLMLHVSLEQIRRARTMSLEDELRMELDMMHYVFRKGDGVEGIRALAVDKDHKPRWQDARVDEVDREKVLSFFDSPWRTEGHPLAGLGK